MRLDNIVRADVAYEPKERITYKMNKAYIEAKYGFKVYTAYVAEVKIWDCQCMMILDKEIETAEEASDNRESGCDKGYFEIF